MVAYTKPQDRSKVGGEVFKSKKDSALSNSSVLLLQVVKIQRCGLHEILANESINFEAS